MRHAHKLWKALDLLSSARDLTRETTTYRWEVEPPNTFYIDAEYADISLSRQESAEILATVKLQAAFSWQIATQQDKAGVYMVARRKPLIGSIGRGSFQIRVPSDVHISLKLRHCQLCLNDQLCELELPPHATT